MRIRTLTAGIAVLTFAAGAQAELLDLELLDAPDIASGFIDVVYDADDNLFAADGFALSYDDDGMGQADNILNGLFSVDAVINDDGMAESGNIAISGEVQGFSGELLSGSLVDFGFAGSGGMILEFIFSVTGGDLAAAYGGVGTEFGVILDLNSGNYSGDWTMSFDNLQGGQGTGIGVADTAPLVPGPATLALFGAAGLGLTSRRRRA